MRTTILGYARTSFLACRSLLVSLVLAAAASAGEAPAARDAHELNESFETAKEVSLDRDLEATISPAGDKDFYSVAVPSPGFLRVILERCPPEVNPALSIFTASDKPLADFNPHYKSRQGKNVILGAEIGAAGKCVVLVHDGSGSSGDPPDNAASAEPYRFRLDFVPAPDPQEPNEAPEAARPVEPGKPVQAWLFPAGDRDWYRADLPAPGLGILTVRVTGVSESINPKVTVLCPDGRKLASETYYKNRAGADISWSIETWEPGPYSICLQDGSGWSSDPEDNASSTRPYEIRADFAPCGDRKGNRTIATALEVAPGSSVTGALFPTGSLRTYRIPVPPPGQGRLNALVTDLAANVSPQLILLKPKAGANLEGLDEGEWRKRLDAWCLDPAAKDVPPFDVLAHLNPWYAGTEGRPALIAADLDRPGECYLILRDGRAHSSDPIDNQGSPRPYTLRVDLSAVADPNEPNGELAEAREIPWDSPVSVKLFPQGDRDLFWVQVERPAQLDVILAGIPAGYEPLLEVLDGGGKKIPFPEAWDSRPYVFSGALPAAGKYYVSLGERRGRASKDPLTVLVHREEVEVAEAEPNGTPETAVTLEPGNTLAAQIFPGSDVDLYAIQAPGPSRIEIFLTGLPGPVETPARLLAADSKTMLVDGRISAPPEPLAGRTGCIAWETRGKERLYLRVGDERGGQRSASVRPYRVRLALRPVATEGAGVIDDAGTNDAPGGATPLAQGKPVDALLFPRTDIDVYAIEIPEKTSIVAIIENPGGLTPRLRISPAAEPGKVLAEAAASFEYDPVVQLDEAAPGKYLLSVSDPSDNPFYRRASALPYRIAWKATPTAAWAAASASKREAAKAVPLGEWQALEIPEKDPSLWCRLSFPASGRLRICGSAVNPSASLSFRFWEAGAGGDLVTARLESRVSTSHGGVYHVTRASTGPSEILVEASAWDQEPPKRRFLLLADLVPSKAASALPLEKAQVLAGPRPLGPLPPATATWLAADAAGPGRVRVTLEGLAETRDVRTDLFFGPRELGARPTVIHAVGYYGDAALSRRFPDLDWTVVASRQPIPAPVPPGTAAVFIDSALPEDVGLDRPEVLAALVEYARGGGRVLVASPRGASQFFGATFAEGSRGRSRSGEWKDLEAAGFSPTAREGTSVIAAEKKVGKGIVLLDARLLRVTALNDRDSMPAFVLWSKLGVAPKLLPIAEAAAPIWVPLSGGAQVLEVPVPSEGRLYLRFKEESAFGMPFEARASAEFLPKARAAEAPPLAPGAILPLEGIAAGETAVLRTTLAAGESALLALANRSWGIAPSLTVHEELPPLDQQPLSQQTGVPRPRVLLLSGWRDGGIERYYPGIDFDRRGPEDAAFRGLPSDLASYRAVLFDRIRSPSEFGLDLPEVAEKLEAYAAAGGRVVVSCPHDFSGPILGAVLAATWAREPLSLAPEFARLLPDLGAFDPKVALPSSGRLTLPADSGYVPLATLSGGAEKIAIAARPAGKGLVVIDLQPACLQGAGGDGMPPGWDAKLRSELGCGITHRWIGDFRDTLDGRAAGGQIIPLVAKEKTSFRVSIGSADARSEGGRVAAVLLSLVRPRPFEPNDGFLEATPIRSGEAVRANLTPADERDFFEIAAPAKGVLGVSVVDTPATQDIAVDVYRKAEKLRPFPRILYLVGGRNDYNLQLRFPDLTFRRIDWNAPEAAGWLDLLAGCDAAIVDGLTSLAQFAMNRPETYDRIRTWVEAGGRFLVVCPQGVSPSLIAAQNGGSIVSASSMWDSGRWKADSLIDGVSAPGNPSGWCCGNGAKFPHEIVFAFPGKKPAEFDRFVVCANGQSDAVRIKDFEVLAAEGEDPAAGPWESLGKHVAQPIDLPQVFPVGKKTARFLKIVISSNYGHPVETQLGEVAVLSGDSPLLFGLLHTGQWTKEAIARDPSAAAAFPAASKGPVNGWAVSDAHGWWLGWKEAGFLPLYVYPGKPEGRAATVYRRLGKGTIVAETQEIGHPSNVAGNWKIHELLESAPQITLVGTWDATQRQAGMGGEAFEVLLKEPGSAVLVLRDNARSPRDEEYALRAVFRPLPFPFEPNDTAQEAAVLQLGRPVPNSLETKDDVDWFAFDVRTEGYLHIRVSGVPLSLAPGIDLFHGSDPGKPVGSWTRTQEHTPREEAVSVPILRPGVHYLRIADRGQGASTTEPFALEAWLDPFPAFEESNDSPESARPLRPGFQAFSVAPAADVDWYSFSMPSAGDLLLDVLGVAPFQSIGAQVFKAGEAARPIADLAVGLSDSFRLKLDAGKYLLKIYEQGADQSSLVRSRLRAEWPGGVEAAAGEPSVVRVYPTDRSAWVDPAAPIEIGFDRAPSGVAGWAAVAGTISGEVGARAEAIPLEAAVRLVPQRRLAPEETVTVRGKGGDALSVYSTSPESQEPGAPRPLEIVLPRGRFVPAGKVPVTVKSSVPLAGAPALRFTPRGAKPIEVRDLASDDSLAWSGDLEVPAGTPDGLAVFDVMARTAEGSEIRSIQEAGRTFAIDTTPPDAPGELRGRPRRLGAVELSWKAPAGDPAALYRLYRKGEKLAEVRDASAWADTPPAEGTYRYAVSAVDAAGNEGARSVEVTVVSDRTPPADAPKSLAAATLEGGKAALSWEGPEGGLWNVYRSGSEIAEGAQLQLPPVAEGLRQPAFADAPGDGKWNYAVCLTDEAGNLGPLSNRVSVAIDTTGPLVTITIERGAVEGRPPFGEGTYPVALEVSEPLAEDPELWIEPRGKKRVPVPLVKKDDAHYLGVLEVKLDFGEGRAAFGVACRDSSGNASRGLGGRDAAVVIDTRGPTVTARREGLQRLAPGRNRILFEADEPLSRLEGTAAVADGEKKPLAIVRSGDEKFHADLEVPAGCLSGVVALRMTSVDSGSRTSEQDLSIDVDGKPPVAPADLIGRPTGEKTVELEWAAIPEEVSGYRVYRAEAPEGLPRGRIAAGVSETRYADPVVAERVYFYAVAAVDLAGNESPLSAPVRVVADVTATGPPVLLEPSVDATSTVRLEWKPPTERDGVTYNVYRDAAEFKDRLGRKPIASRLSVASFADVPVLSGRYFYAVAAIDAAGNESRLSEVRAVDFSQTRPVASIGLARPSPVRESVRFEVRTLKPLVRRPSLSLAFADGSSLDLPLAGDGASWAGALPVSPKTPNGPARFSYQGESAGGIATGLISEGETIAIDTVPPVAFLALRPSGSVRPGPVSVRATASEALAGPPRLSVTLPGENPRAVPLAEDPAERGVWIGRLDVPPEAKEGTAIFRVETVDLAGNTGEALGSGDRFVIDTTPPKAPGKLEATVLRGGAVGLSWTPPAYGADEPPEQIAGYNVYRSTKPIEDVRELAPVAVRVRELRHQDLPPADGAWHYAACTVDAAGLESPPSARVEARSDRKPPDPPKILSAGLSPAKTRMVIAWEPAGEEPAAAFRLYRSSKPILKTEGLAPLSGDIEGKERRAEDVPRENGRIYYAIAAVDAAGNESAPSVAYPVEYAMVAPAVKVKLPAARLQAGKHAVEVAATRPLSGAPSLSALLPGAEEPVALEVTGSGATWRGILTIPDGTPDGKVRLLFAGKAVEGGEEVTGDAIFEGETFEVDGAPPTAKLLFEGSPARRGNAVVLREGKHAFLLEASEPLSGEPALSLLPRKGDPISIGLAAIDPQRYRGSVEISAETEEGPATFDFRAKDIAGNAGNRILDGGYLVVDRTPPAAPDPVQALPLSLGSVRFGWTRTGDEGDVRFQVFRARRRFTDASSLTPIADLRLALSHVDHPAEDGTYYYAVRALDDAGNVGPLSEVLEVRCDETPPAPPRGLQAEEKDGVIHLTWSLPEGEKPFLYNAYFGEGPISSTQGARSLGRNIPGAFTEIYGAPEENGTYFISLTSVDEAMNESAPSEPVRVEYRRFGALARIVILRPLKSEVAATGLEGLDRKARAERVNRVKPGKYEVSLVASKLLAEAPKLSYVPEKGGPVAISLVGAGAAWTATLEIPADAPEGAAYFQVGMVDTDGISSSEILEGEYFAIDTAPPAVPPGFGAEALTGESQGAIRLSWQTPQGEVPHFYRVYRSERSVADLAGAVPAALVPIAVVKVRFENESRYEHLDLPPRDGTYHYAVTGLDLAGNESPRSESRSAESSTTSPRASIRLRTAASGEEAARVVGPEKVAVVLETSRPLTAAPSLAYRRKGGEAARSRNVVLDGSGALWKGEFEVPREEEDGEFEFAFRGRGDAGVDGTFIAQGKEFRVDRKPPMAEILIPTISKLEVQLSWDGAEKHRLEMPPLSMGTHDIEVTILRDMPDDERIARWARGDPGDPKELLGPPELHLETADGKGWPVRLDGFGARWRGRVSIPREAANGEASFRFRGSDRFGNETRKIAPLRRWHVVDDTNPEEPRVVANYATTGGRMAIDTVPPSSPVLKDLVVRKLGVVEIAWVEPEGEVPASYRVYRSLLPISEDRRGTMIEGRVLAKVWVDAPPHDGNWFYAATAVDLAGNESTLARSKMTFVDSIKPELKITPVPLDDDFVIIEVESDQPVLSVELAFPGQARKQAILGGESGELEKRGERSYVYRQKLPLPQLQEVFNGKVEVVVHSPDPVGNVVSTSAPLSAGTISSATGGFVESADGEVKLVVPPGVKPVRSQRREQRVIAKDEVFFVSYAYIPAKAKPRIIAPCATGDIAGKIGLPEEVVAAALDGLEPGRKAGEPIGEALARDLCAALGRDVEVVAEGMAGGKGPAAVEPLPPGLEVVGKPYVVQINQPPGEPLELKASATQADLSGLKSLPTLVMKVPESLSSQYDDPEFMGRKIKVMAWNPAPEGDERKARWEVVDRVQLDPQTKELIVPAEKVTTYVIVSERTPPTITDLFPAAGASLAEPAREVRCRVIDKGTGVATGPENRVRIEFDGTPVDPAYVALGEGDPTEVPVTFALSAWLEKTKPATKGILPPGPHRVRAYAQDIVENVGIETWEFTFDDKPPEILGAYPSDGAVLSSLAPAFTAELADDAGIDAATIRVEVDGVEAGPEEIEFDAQSGVLTCLATRPLEPGKHRFTIDVKDSSGKPARRHAAEFTVDAEGPSLSLVEPAPGTTARANRIGLTLRVADPVSGVDPSGLEVTVDGMKAEATFDPAAGKASGAIAVADGRHRIEARARDRAGNVSRGSWSFEADGRGPIFFDLGARTSLALRVDDFGSGVDPASLRLPPRIDGAWDPATGVLVAGTPPAQAQGISISDLAGNVSVYSPPGVPISEYERMRIEAGKAPAAAIAAQGPEAPKKEEQPSAAGGTAAPGGKAPAEPAAGPPLWPWIVGGAAVLLVILSVFLAARVRKGR